MELELVSFVLCPFVQRSVIALREKGVEFRTTYIDLEDPPDWFCSLSPTGKVPLLRVDGAVLFESAIINEYLDETCPPPLHPADPLERARHRGWIEFGSSLLFDQFAVLMADGEDTYQQRLAEFAQKLARLEQPLADAVFGAPDRFTLLDAAYAPLFMRYRIAAAHRADFAAAAPPAVLAWGRRLLERPAVSGSVVDDFETLFVRHFDRRGSWLFNVSDC